MNSKLEEIKLNLHNCISESQTVFLNILENDINGFQRVEDTCIKIQRLKSS